MLLGTAHRLQKEQAYKSNQSDHPSNESTIEIFISKKSNIFSWEYRVEIHVSSCSMLHANFSRLFFLDKREAYMKMGSAFSLFVLFYSAGMKKAL